MNSTPPRFVVVGPHRYTVAHDPDTSRMLRNDSERGKCDVDALMIRLDGDLPASQLAETLLHEVIHAVWRGTGLPAIETLDEHEEHIVRCLSALLYQVLHDNPALLAFLTAKEPADATGT